METISIEQNGIDILSHTQIRVNCPYPIQYITGIDIESRIGEHGQITITGILHEEEGANCLASATTNDQIIVYDTSESSEGIRIFSGIVICLQVRHENGVYHIEIKGMSYTYLLDIKLKSRSFQNTEATYYEVTQKVLENYPYTAFIWKLEDRTIDHMLVQFKETDWTFLKRLATHFNTVLIADSMGDYPRFWTGIHKTPKQLEDILNYTTKKDMERFRYVSEHGFDVSEWDFMKREFWSSSRLSLGDYVTFQGIPYIVEHVKANFENGLFRYFYVIGREKGLIQPLQRNEQLSGVSLLGKVIETKDSYVRIHLNIDKSQDIETANWIPFASEGNNVFYCMPEIGEKVSLYFSNSNEADAIAINAVRVNGGSCNMMVDYYHRRYMNTTGQEIGFCPEGIDIAYDGYAYINVSNEGEIYTYSYDSIYIICEQRIIFEAGECIYCGVSDNCIEAEAGNITIAVPETGQYIYIDSSNDCACVYSPDNIITYGELRTELKSANGIIKVEEVPPQPRWQRVLAVVAVVAVTVAVIVTGGAALALVAKAAKIIVKKAALKKKKALLKKTKQSKTSAQNTLTADKNRLLDIADNTPLSNSARRALKDRITQGVTKSSRKATDRFNSAMSNISNNHIAAREAISNQTIRFVTRVDRIVTGIRGMGLAAGAYGVAHALTASFDPINCWRAIIARYVRGVTYGAVAGVSFFFPVGSVGFFFTIAAGFNVAGTFASRFIYNPIRSRLRTSEYLRAGRVDVWDYRYLGEALAWDIFFAFITAPLSQFARLSTEVTVNVSMDTVGDSRSHYIPGYDVYEDVIVWGTRNVQALLEWRRNRQVRMRENPPIVVSEEIVRRPSPIDTRNIPREHIYPQPGPPPPSSEDILTIRRQQEQIRQQERARQQEQTRLLRLGIPITRVNEIIDSPYEILQPDSPFLQAQVQMIRRGASIESVVNAISNIQANQQPFELLPQMSLPPSQLQQLQQQIPNQSNQ